jgi:hypothetical protein
LQVSDPRTDMAAIKSWLRAQAAAAETITGHKRIKRAGDRFRDGAQRQSARAQPPEVGDKKISTQTERAQERPR